MVRHVNILGGDGVVIHSRLSSTTADSDIREQVEYFRGLGQPFEWKVYAYDEPPDLIERLRAGGFELGERETVMVMDLDSHAPREAPSVRRVSSDGLDEIAEVRRRVYSDRVPEEVTEQLAYELEHHPGYLSVYVATVNDQPAAAGWIRFPPSSAFASLWGGATVPELRQHGLYTALLLARLGEAKRRGYRYVTIDAGPMSRPIVEKHGFRVLTYATACVHRG